MEIVTADGDQAVIVAAVATERREQTYNFEVEGFHTYFVGEAGLWVHNACDIANRLAQLGGGLPRFVPTPKGASQFIFPNGMVLRFDLKAGQFLGKQGPHINLQNVPGSRNPNIHIDLRP